jgi:hypothetical protein
VLGWDEPITGEEALRHSRLLTRTAEEVTLRGGGTRPLDVHP